jgi:hypothetical protein
LDEHQCLGAGVWGCARFQMFCVCFIFFYSLLFVFHLLCLGRMTVRDTLDGKVKDESFSPAFVWVAL